MELEILKLVFDYSIKGRILDVNCVDKIVSIVVNANGLHDYVNDIVIADTLPRDGNYITVACYRPFDKKVFIGSDGIQATFEQQNMYNSLFNSIEQVMYKNLLIVEHLLHELIHAHQHKVLDSIDESSIEAKLIKACFYVIKALNDPNVVANYIIGNIPINQITKLVQNYNDAYLSFYNFAPTERLAETGSFMSILRVLEPLKESFPALYEFNNASLVESMIMGYRDSFDMGLCPTQVYLRELNKEDVWTGFDFYNKNDSILFSKVCSSYSLQDRLTYGLPVSNQELDGLETWLQSTNKYRC